MSKSTGIILREFVGIRGGPTEETSYEANLRACLAAKKFANAEADMTGAGHAARGAAECYRRLGRMNEAEQEYKTATNLFRIVGNYRGLAWTFYAYSNFLRQTSRFFETTSALSESIFFAQSCQDLALVAYIMAGIAENTRIVGDYRLAHRQHLAAFRIFRSLEDRRGIIWALEGIGQILKNTGRLRKALECFTEAKRLAIECNDLRGLAYALKCRAECLSGLGHHYTAIEEALFAVQIFENIGLKVGLAYTLKSLGDIFRAHRENTVALANYRKAAHIFSQSGDARGLAYTFNGLGSLLSEMDGADNAGICYAHAANYFRSSGVNFGRTQGVMGLLNLTRKQQITKKQICEIYQGGMDGQLPLPNIVLEKSDVLPPERRELVQAGWQLLNQYRRCGVRYLRAEKAKVWDGANQADCSSFVQHVLIAAGYKFARNGRLTTWRLQGDSFWSRCFQEIPYYESKPGDIILQGGRHMGIFTGFRDGQPSGLQMGVASNASELIWGENGDTASIGSDMRFFRLKPFLKH